MKASYTLSALLSSSLVWSKPVEKRQDFTKIDYPEGTGANLEHYPPGTGENLDSYPPGTGENLDSYPPGTGETNPCPSNANPVFPFTSTYHIEATPDQVVNGTDNPVFTGGLEGSSAFFDFGINSDLDLICYSIKLIGFRGEYQSPAKTATHVHEAARGRNGPPRLAFPNPEGDGHERYSFGCMRGPFTTGLVQEGKDTGEGFTLKQIEDDSQGFFADIHSSLAVPGAVRGQFP